MKNEDLELDKQMHKATDNTNISRMKDLVNKGANINNSDLSGYTVLMSAIESENVEVVKFLISKKVDVNKGSILPLDMAINIMSYARLIAEEQIISLVSLRKSVNERNEERKAAKVSSQTMIPDSEDIVTMLIAAKAKTSASYYKILLEYGAQYKTVKELDIIINEVQCEDNDADGKDERIKTFLIENKVVLNELTKYYIDNNNIDRLKNLFKVGEIDVKELDSSFLFSAIESAKLEIVKLFLDEGVPHKLKDWSGKYLLQAAKESGNKEIQGIIYEKYSFFDRVNDRIESFFSFIKRVFVKPVIQPEEVKAQGGQDRYISDRKLLESGEVNSTSFSSSHGKNNVKRNQNPLGK